MYCALSHFSFHPPTHPPRPLCLVPSPSALPPRRVCVVHVYCGGAVRSLRTSSSSRYGLYHSQKSAGGCVYLQVPRSTFVKISAVQHLLLRNG